MHFNQFHQKCNPHCVTLVNNQLNYITYGTWGRTISLAY